MREASMWVRTMGAAISVMALCAATPARAGLTGDSCQARKVKEQGKYLACRASESAKALRGKPADLAACDARFADVAAKLNAQAAAAGIQCRYRDNGDGTVTDLDTGLQWEQKTNDASIHDVANLYSWSASGTAADGTLFTEFLAGFHDCESSDGGTVTGGLGGHCDWRVPSIAELRTIQLPFPCGAGPCIDPIFGPTASAIYWSETIAGANPNEAWAVHFYDVDPFFGVYKTVPLHARAVRGGF